jgi:hypothetical protein
MRSPRRLREFSTSCPRIIDKAIDTQSFLLLLEHSIGRQWSVMDWSASSIRSNSWRIACALCVYREIKQNRKKPTSAISSRRACSSGNALRLSIAISPKTQFASGWIWNICGPSLRALRPDDLLRLFGGDGADDGRRRGSWRRAASASN